MKLKYYLRGMGIGIIVTTVILMIIFSFHKRETLSDDQIRERAAALGMVMADEASDSGKLSDTLTDDTPDTASDQNETDDQNTSNENSNQNSDQSADQTSSAANTQNDDNKGKKDTSDDKGGTKKNDVETVEQIELSIVGGEYSDAVSKKLKKAGLIEDADDFNKYLSEGGYDSLIQPGTYVIPKGADYDTIIQMITEKDDDKKTDQTKKTKNKK